MAAQCKRQECAFCCQTTLVLLCARILNKRTIFDGAQTKNAERKNMNNLISVEELKH